MLRIVLKKEEIYQGNLILINRSCPLKGEPKEEELTAIFGQPGMQMRTEAAEALQCLLGKLQMTDMITGVSAYRKKSEQIAIFEDSLRENGRTFTETYVAFPDCSEHQTGLAIDLAKRQKKIDFICPEFPYDGVFRKFRMLAPYYGFVERYRSGKENVTGIGAEPWHFRYVGIPHAFLMTEYDLSLEEYMEGIRLYDWKKNSLRCRAWGKEIRIGFLPYRPELSLELSDGDCIKISGNNRDGFIVTMFGAESGQAEQNPFGMGKRFLPEMAGNVKEGKQGAYEETA